MDFSNIRGFNYQPSYGTTGMEIWLNFDPDTIQRELDRGRKFFPKMNALRVWLSWDAFQRDATTFCANFDHLLSMAEERDLRVMPVLFNRWHDFVLDYGGIYIDHFLPGGSFFQDEKLFDPFVDAVVGQHSDDQRIFAWDLCNEPFFYHLPPADVPKIFESEFAWLERMYNLCKASQAAAPVTVGLHSVHGRDGMEMADSISDFFSIHPYFTLDRPPHEKSDFEQLLDAYVEFARTRGKQILATETCWGHVEDHKRVEIIRYTLHELKKRKIGWLSYLLHHSLVADAHRAEYGPVGEPGILSFIEADGTLRPGHDIWNEF